MRVEHRDDGWSAEAALEELTLLCDTARLNVVGAVTQTLKHPNPRSYVGTGKLEEVKSLRQALEANVIVCDDELSPAQMRNIERRLDAEEHEIKVIDRPTLILDIFAQHAVTREGRLQVELAQLEYRLPRLTRMWSHLSRQAVGGVGLRGPGETQLEVDRRLAEIRIHRIKSQLDQVHRHRELYRQRRRRNTVPIVAFVGYTNAGKSTLLNRLTDAGVTEADKLFATLDPTTRRLELPSGRTVLLTDTVGFIHNLPTSLIAAFRATLEEIKEAVVLLHVLDVTHEFAAEQADIVISTLDELDVAQKPIVTALNKIDLLDAEDVLAMQCDVPAEYIPVSARTGYGISELLATLDRVISESFDYVRVDVCIPYPRTDLVDLFHRIGTVESQDFVEAGTLLSGELPARFGPRFSDYQVISSAADMHEST